MKLGMEWNDRIFTDKHPSAIDIITEIDSAYDAKDTAQITFLAHKFKSSVCMMGANTLADLYLALEFAGKEDNWDKIKQNYVDLLPSLKLVTHSINSL